MTTIGNCTSRGLRWYSSKGLLKVQHYPATKIWYITPKETKLRTGLKQLPLKYINPCTTSRTGNFLSGSDTTNLRTCHLKPIWQDTSPLLSFHLFSRCCVLSSDWLTLSLWYSCTDKSPPALSFIANFKQPL